jgi:hypothetical protein
MVRPSSDCIDWSALSGCAVAQTKRQGQDVQIVIVDVFRCAWSGSGFLPHSIRTARLTTDLGSREVRAKDDQ